MLASGASGEARASAWRTENMRALLGFTIALATTAVIFAVLLGDPRPSRAECAKLAAAGQALDACP